MSTEPADRAPLRLVMRGRVTDRGWDGGWWPQSRELTVELADLVDHFPADFGRVVRAVYSPPDWDPAPRRIAVAGGHVKAGSFPRDDTHLILLTTSDRVVLRVLVVPPTLNAPQATAVLHAVAEPGSQRSAEDLLGLGAERPH